MKKLILCLALLSSTVAFSDPPELTEVFPGLFYEIVVYGECSPDYSDGVISLAPARRTKTTYTYFGCFLVATDSELEQCQWCAPLPVIERPWSMRMSITLLLKVV